MEFCAMIAMLDWIAVAIGCIGIAAAILYWLIGRKTRRHLQQARLDLQNAHKELKEARHRLQELRDTPPVPTDAQFIGLLSALNARIVNCILNLDAARIKSAEPFCWAAEEAEQSQTVSRQERFTRFRDPWPVSARGDEVLMDETAPYRGISSATRFRMR
jgi:hypothetical protein